MILLDPPTTQVFTQRDVDDAWTVVFNDELDEGSGIGGNIVGVLNALGIPTERRGMDFEEIWVSQSLEFADADGYLYPATKGHYRSEYIYHGGTIIAVDNHSPRHAVGANGKVPRLNRWSDMVWHLWSDICAHTGTDVRSLQYIFHDNIITDSTKSIMEYVGGAGQNALDLPWPGLAFGLDTEEGLALLATPHGVGIAYMIKDHSDVLGMREPTVRIFTIEGEYYMMWDL
ncbi:MAG: hypothetical protein Q9213_000788 [Squamulea squamosa]